MKHIYLVGIAGALAVTFMPANASATAPKHHRAHHAHARQPARSAYGAPELPRIPSLDPPYCDSPNVVTVEGCRASSNGDM